MVLLASVMATTQCSQGNAPLSQLRQLIKKRVARRESTGQNPYSIDSEVKSLYATLFMSTWLARFLAFFLRCFRRVASDRKRVSANGRPQFSGFRSFRVGRAPAGRST